MARVMVLIPVTVQDLLPHKYTRQYKQYKQYRQYNQYKQYRQYK